MTAASLLAGVWLLPHLGDLVQTRPPPTLTRSLGPGLGLGRGLVLSLSLSLSLGLGLGLSLRVHLRRSRAPTPKPEPTPDQVMLSSLGDALRTLASADALHLDASCCVGLWLLAAAAALESLAGWL